MFKKVLAFFAAMSLVAAFAAVDVNKASDAELDGIKGIGPWTAAVILLRGLGRLDHDGRDAGRAGRNRGVRRRACRRGKGGHFVGNAEFRRGVVKSAQRIADFAEQAGVPGYFRVPAQNADPAFIGALAGLVRRSLQRGPGLCSHAGGGLCPLKFGDCPHTRAAPADTLPVLAA